jgi:DNA-binding FadR family transcriptional regulator
VAEEIKRWVVAENLVPGDRLPGEQGLIERFGMSKGTIREAMRILEAQGLIRTRTGPGGGSFVHEVSEARARALLWNYFYFKSPTIGDIYELRIALEPELAFALAGRLGEEELAELEAILARYETPPEDVDSERAQHIASLDFHQRLAGFAENPLLGFLIGFTARLLADLTVQRRLYEPRNYALWRQGRDHQVALVAALRRGDAEGARRIMAEHMREARDFMAVQEARMERAFLSER